MRILHIDKFLSPGPANLGGVASHVRRLGQLQRQRGHEVFEFGCAAPGQSGALPRFHDFTASKNPVTLAKMIHNVAAANALEAFCRGCGPDVAHLHNIYHHLTPSILPVLVRRGVGVVLTVHDYRLACPTKHMLRAGGLCRRCLPNRFYHAAGRHCAGLGGVALAVESYVQRLLRRYVQPVSCFLCPTGYMRDVLLRVGVPASKAVVLPNVIEPAPLPAGRDDGRRGELLFAGRLCKEKSPELMVDLAAQLPEAHVTIAGDGPRRGELSARIERLGITNVTMPGALGREELGACLAKATAVVITSRCMENSPQTMLEAMQAGRCVVVPDQPPLREWIADGRTGRLFAPGDASSLVRVCREVLGDVASRRRMAAAALALVGRRHDEQAIMTQVECLYEKAIARCALR